MVYPLNSGKNIEYQQPTPKQRRIAYLKDISDGKQKTTIELIDEYNKR